MAMAVNESLDPSEADAKRFVYNMEHPLKFTKVVNLHNEKCDVYIGRGSIWGNPYKIGDCLTGQSKKSTREDVIEAYRRYFKEMIKTKEFHDKALALQGKTLGCFCKPKACHGDVIVDWLKSYDWDMPYG